MMLCLLLSFSSIAAAYVPRTGYSPVASGLYPAGGFPVYSGYIANPLLYGQQVVDRSDVYEGAGGHRNFVQDGVGRQALREADVLVRKGAEGAAGGHVVVEGNEGKHGYYKDAVGAKYKQQGGGAGGAAKQYGYSGEDGYGGFGTAGHRKGHRTSGFHKSYHNVESGKDTKYVDEDHDVGHEKFGQAYDSAFDDKAWHAQGRGHDEGLFGEQVAHGSASSGGMKSQAAHDAGYDAKLHKGYYNDRDSVYRNGAAASQKGGAGGRGVGGMQSISAGRIYESPMW